MVIKLKPVYYPYHLWEDWQNGMYKNVDNKLLEEMKAYAKDCLTDLAKLYKCMDFVAFNWLHSAKMNLSNERKNRQAWLGQAACCYYAKIPERVTRTVWGELSDKERKEANKIADEIIAKWESKYAKDLS